MPGYGNGCDMGELLLAMKEKPMQSATKLKYLWGVRIKLGPWWWHPYDKFTIYLEPNGSPETEAGQGQNTKLKYATHVVNIECVVPWHSPDEEDKIIGRSNTNVGLTGFVGDTLSYYENNWLGLNGLEPGVGPHCEIQEGGYEDVQIEEQFFIRIARLRYEARTVAFDRPTDT